MIAGILGRGEWYTDPLWAVEFRLTPVERALLRCWPVRRLQFVAHGGAAVVTTHQTYSRLEHSLGLLSLVAKFVEDVLAVEAGSPSVLRGRPGALKLDHLESFVRSGRAHARLREPPPDTLARLRLVDGEVHTDQATASYLADLAVGEAAYLCGWENVVPTAVLRGLAATVLGDTPGVPAATDDELWAVLLADPRPSADARLLRCDPLSWAIFPPSTAGRGGARLTTRSRPRRRFPLMAEFEIDDDRGRVDRDVLWEFLSTKAYWGRFRDRAKVERQLEGAWRVVAAYRAADGAMIGYARAVSDGEAMAYLADVFVVEEARGLGVGKALVHAMIEEGPGPYFRWMLHTLDAHDLYRPFGFAEPDGTYMERKGRNMSVFGLHGTGQEP